MRSFVRLLGVSPLLLATFALLAGCQRADQGGGSASSSSTSKRIGVTLLTREHEFYRDLEAGLKDAADRQGYQPTVTSGDFDLAKQQSHVASDNLAGALLPPVASLLYSSHNHSRKRSRPCARPPSRFMGQSYSPLPAPMRQVRLDVLPTRTVYEFEAEGLRLRLTFLSPLLPDDLDAILALGSYAVLCDMTTRKAEARTYRRLAEEMAAKWIKMADAAVWKKWRGRAARAR